MSTVTPHTKSEPLTWLQIEKLAASEEGIDSQRYIRAAVTHIEKQRREITRLLEQKAALKNALHDCVEHLEWCTEQGQAAYVAAVRLLDPPLETEVSK